MLADFRAAVLELLDVAGVDYVTDPAALGTPGVLVGLPSVTVDVTERFGNASLVITVVEPPPGDVRAGDRLIDTVDEVLVAVATIFVSALPGPVSYGDGTVPGYRITVQTPGTFTT